KVKISIFLSALFLFSASPSFAQQPGCGSWDEYYRHDPHYQKILAERQKAQDERWKKILEDYKKWLAEGTGIAERGELLGDRLKDLGDGFQFAKDVAWSNYQNRLLDPRTPELEFVLDIGHWSNDENAYVLDKTVACHGTHWANTPDYFGQNI